MRDACDYWIFCAISNFDSSSGRCPMSTSPQSPRESLGFARIRRTSRVFHITSMQQDVVVMSCSPLATVRRYSNLSSIFRIIFSRTILRQLRRSVRSRISARFQLLVQKYARHESLKEMTAVSSQSSCVVAARSSAKRNYSTQYLVSGL